MTTYVNKTKWINKTRYVDTPRFIETPVYINVTTYINKTKWINKTRYIDSIVNTSQRLETPSNNENEKKEKEESPDCSRLQTRDFVLISIASIVALAVCIKESMDFCECLPDTDSDEEQARVEDLFSTTDYTVPELSDGNDKPDHSDEEAHGNGAREA